MSLNSNISLTFTVKNNTLKLESSSENKSLDNRVATLAGTNLNKILDRLQVKPSWADKTSVTMELNRNGNTYLADIFLPDSNPVANIKLNDEFVKTLSGVVEDPEEGWVMVESNKSKESAKTAAMPVAYLGEGSTFEVDGQKYYIAYTTGDGACGAHALLGTKSYWIGSYYFDKVRDHYTSTLSKQMKNPSIKTNGTS